MGPPDTVSPGRGSIQCRLQSAHDLAAIFSVLQLRERDQKDQRVHCEISERGFKLTAQSSAKDVAIMAWIMRDNFSEYNFVGVPVDKASNSELHLRLPLAPLLNCLQIFGDRATLTLRYPSGPSDDLQLTLEEDGASTECFLKTLVFDDVPTPPEYFFAPGDTLSTFRPLQPETWHSALNEFTELDAPDVALRLTLRGNAKEDDNTPALTLRATTITSDVEVEVARTSVDELVVAADAADATGEVVHRFGLTSVLSSCLRSAKDAKAVKVRFNRDGVMSTQCILRGRGGRDFYCEVLVCPLTESVMSGVDAGSGLARSNGRNTAPPLSSAINGHCGVPAESLGF